MRFLSLFSFAAVLASAPACQSYDSEIGAGGARDTTVTDNDVPLDPLPRPGVAEPRARLPVPPPASYAALYVDLLASQSPAKSQGGRNLCTVFATTAMMEYLAISTGFDGSPDYSEQWLFWSAQTMFPAKEGSAADTGYSTGAANVAAAQSGVPSSAAWPYVSHTWSPTGGHPECTGTPEPLPCYTDGAPPAEAVAAPKVALRGGISGIAPKDIKAWLATHRTPVIASTAVYCQAWNLACGGTASDAEYYRKGWITYPNAGDHAEGGHEFLIVGWDDITAIPIRDAQGNVLYESDGVTPQTEKGFYIFKNSWTSKGFGSESAYAPGYGLISQRYMSDFGSSAAVLSGDATLVFGDGSPAAGPNVPR
jgi:hypothetical protein